MLTLHSARLGNRLSVHVCWTNTGCIFKTPAFIITMNTTFQKWWTMFLQHCKIKIYTIWQSFRKIRRILKYVDNILEPRACLNISRGVCVYIYIYICISTGMYVCISVYVKVYSFIYFGKGGEGVKITHSVGLRQFLIKVTSFTPASNSPNIFWWKSRGVPTLA